MIAIGAIALIVRKEYIEMLEIFIRIIICLKALVIFSTDENLLKASHFHKKVLDFTRAVLAFFVELAGSASTKNQTHEESSKDPDREICDSSSLESLVPVQKNSREGQSKISVDHFFDSGASQNLLLDRGDLNRTDHPLHAGMDRYSAASGIKGINNSTYTHDMRYLCHQFAASSPLHRDRLVGLLSKKRFLAAIDDTTGLRSLRRPDEVYLPTDVSRSPGNDSERRFRVDLGWLPLADDPAKHRQLIQLLNALVLASQTERKEVIQDPDYQMTPTSKAPSLYEQLSQAAA